MKLLALSLALINSIAIFAQGDITYYNRQIQDASINGGAARNVPIALMGLALPNNPFPGTDFSIGLFQQVGNTFVLVPNSVTTFRNNATTGLPDGYMQTSVNVVVPGVPAGSPLTFQLRTWYTADGSYENSPWRGASQTMTVSQLGGITPGNSIVQTPNLSGLGFTGFSFVPEASTYALAASVLAAAVLHRRKRFSI